MHHGHHIVKIDAFHTDHHQQALLAQQNSHAQHVEKLTQTIAHLTLEVQNHTKGKAVVEQEAFKGKSLAQEYKLELDKLKLLNDEYKSKHDKMEQHHAVNVKQLMMELEHARKVQQESEHYNKQLSKQITDLKHECAKLNQKCQELDDQANEHKVCSTFTKTYI